MGKLTTSQSFFEGLQVRRALCGLLIAAAFVVAAPPAFAAPANAIGPVYGATFSGHASGQDTANIFNSFHQVDGVTKNDIDSDFTAIFFIDTSRGFSDGGVGFADRYTGFGNVDDAGDAGFIKGYLTINGVTVEVDSSNFGTAFANGGNPNAAPNGSGGSTYVAPPTGFQNTVYDYARDTSFSAGLLRFSTAQHSAELGLEAFTSLYGLLPSSLNQAFTAGGQTGYILGNGAFSVSEVSTAFGNSGPTYKQIETIELTPTIASAPEPSTWALMMLGVGAIGWVVGYRKRVVVDRKAKLAAIG